MVYRYRMEKTTLDFGFGTVHTSSFVDKPSFSIPESRSAKSLVAAAKRAFENGAPEYFVLGDPSAKDFLTQARRTGKPLSFGVYANPQGRVVFEDSLVGYEGVFPVVGTITLHPDGTKVFNELEKEETPSPAFGM